MSTTASSSTPPDGVASTTAPTPPSLRPRKRVKATDTTGRTVRVPKTGRLSQLMSIPMDVIMEIFGHLHPLDLLHLARTTKALRRVLMHRSSLFVWKAALSTVPGLPDCPPELSEPKWANLVFDAHCNFCLRPNIGNIDWVLRVRLCTTCTNQHLTDWTELGGTKDYHVDMTGTVPHRYSSSGYPQFLRDEYQKVHLQYCAIENFLARREFFLERLQFVQRIEEHAKLCVAWADAQALARHQAIVDKLVTLGWWDEIQKIPAHDTLMNHRLVNAPQILTDRIWAKISGPMIEYMENMKANRLARELETLRPQRMLDAGELLRQYKTKRAPFTNVMPELIDFCALGPVKEIIDQPLDVTVDSASFLHLMSKLDDLVEEWRRTILTELINEVKVGVVKRYNALTNNPLYLHAPLANDPIILHHMMQLACVVFTCIPCRVAQGPDDLFTHYQYYSSSSAHPTISRRLRMRLLWYPRVLAHRCLTKPRRAWGVPIPVGASRMDAIPCYRRRWCCDSVVKVDEEASWAAVAIVQACGMDPRIARVEEMDEVDARVECLACLDGPRHVVFGWRSAVKHQCERHPSDLGDWRVLTAKEADLVRAAEGRWGRVGVGVTPNGMVPADLKVWLCLRCIDGPAEGSWATLEVVREHVKRIHGVLDPWVDRDYVKDFAAPELYATSTLFKAAVVGFPGGGTLNL